MIPYPLSRLRPAISLLAAQPDAVIIDADGFRLLWPDQPLAIGKEFEIAHVLGSDVTRLATVGGPGEV